MLVLSRSKNESIIINHNITVVIVDVRGDRVRLGISAPKDVPVHRLEVELEINKEAMNRGEEASQQGLESEGEPAGSDCGSGA